MARSVYEIADRSFVIGALAHLLAGVAALVLYARTRIEQRRRSRALERARDDRETRMEDANARRIGLTLMTDLADAIRRYDPSAAARLDLERLLDRYADLAIASARWRIAVKRIDARGLLRAGSVTASLPRAIAARRLAHRQRCRDRWLELETELAIVHERFATLALRTATRAT